MQKGAGKQRKFLVEHGRTMSQRGPGAPVDRTASDVIEVGVMY